MTLPEVLLWQQLQKRPGGFKFRRQQAAGPYVGDFYCHQAQLLIEIDGEAHSRGDAPDWDLRRDAEIERQAVRVLRIPAGEVLHNMEGALTYIVEEAARGITPPPCSAWSPSPQGEDR
jgi:very-short-patch-repair endonuclease